MRFTLPLLVLGIVAPTIGAQPQAEKLPVAVIMAQKAVMESTPGKAVIETFVKYRTKQQADLTAKRQEAEKLQADLQAKDKTLTPEQKDQLKKKIEALEAEAGAVENDLRRYVQRLQRTAFPQLQKEADRLIQEYAKEKGIQIVIDTSGEEGSKLNLLFVAQGVDITDEILKRMDKVKIEIPMPGGVEQPGPGPKVMLETTAGNIVVELDEKKAPATVANFLKYVDGKHYDGTVFHRVIKDFMIQGGGFSKDLVEKPTGDPVKNEAKNGLSNTRGTISMARTNDPNSATAQFFINVVDNARLDHQDDNRYGYCVFGKVIEGMDTVEKIRNAKTGEAKGMENVPLDLVIIKSARRVEEPKK